MLWQVMTNYDMLRDVTCWDILWHVKNCYDILWHVTNCCDMLVHVVTCYDMMWHVTSCCDMWRYIVTCCDMLRTVVTCWDMLGLLWYVATCCDILRHVVTFWDMLWHVETCCDMLRHVEIFWDMLWHIVTCWDMLWHVTRCCDILWHFVTCCRYFTQVTTMEPGRWPRCGTTTLTPPITKPPHISVTTKTNFLQLLSWNIFFLSSRYHEIFSSFPSRCHEMSAKEHLRKVHVCWTSRRFYTPLYISYLSHCFRRYSFCDGRNLCVYTPELVDKSSSLQSPGATFPLPAGSRHVRYCLIHIENVTRLWQSNYEIFTNKITQLSRGLNDSVVSIVSSSEQICTSYNPPHHTFTYPLSAFVCFCWLQSRFGQTHGSWRVHRQNHGRWLGRPLPDYRQNVSIHQ